MQVDRICPIRPKHLFKSYCNNGFGRDTYISHPENQALTYGNNKNKIAVSMDFKLSFQPKKKVPNLLKPQSTCHYR